jgi:hypothetical protein
MWNVVGVVSPIVHDDRLGPPEVRGCDGLGVVYLLYDVLVLTSRRMSGVPPKIIKMVVTPQVFN